MIDAGDHRTEPPTQGDEKSTLTGFLKWQRQTFEWKCQGLTPDELARRAVDPSSLSLLGLIRHMADVERSWFRRGLAKQDAPPRFYSDDNPDGDFLTTPLRRQSASRKRGRRGGTKWRSPRSLSPRHRISI